MPIYRVGLATRDDVFFGHWLIKADDDEHAEIRARYKSAQQWGITSDELYIFEFQELPDAEEWMKS